MSFFLFANRNYFSFLVSLEYYILYFREPNFIVIDLKLSLSVNKCYFHKNPENQIMYQFKMKSYRPCMNFYI